MVAITEGALIDSCNAFSFSKEEIEFLEEVGFELENQIKVISNDYIYLYGIYENIDYYEVNHIVWFVNNGKKYTVDFFKGIENGDVVVYKVELISKDK